MSMLEEKPKCLTDLPGEILNDILSRLPTRSVKCSKCVCKTFESLTKTPHFLAAHIRRTTTATATELCSIQYHTDQYNTDHILIDNNNNRSVSVLSIKSRHPIPTATVPAGGGNRRKVRLIGSSNGLLCSHVWREDEDAISILLWNPVTKQNRFIPKPHDVECCEVIWGFGFVPETNDYKVVRIASFPLETPNVQVYKLSTDGWTMRQDSKPRFSRCVPNKVEFDVYSLFSTKWCSGTASLSRWGLDVKPISYVLIRGPCYCSLVPFKGAFHFLAVVPQVQYGVENDLAFIALVSFDLKDEQLRLIDVLGSEMVPDPLIGTTFGVLDESFVLVSTRCNACDIWVMNEYGMHESWTKRFSFTEFPDSLWPIDYWKDYILLMAETEHDKRIVSTVRDLRMLPTLNGRLSLYNLRSGERKRLPIKGNFNCVNMPLLPLPAPGRFDCFPAMGRLDGLTLSSYIETFVPITPGNSIAEVAHQ